MKKYIFLSILYIKYCSLLYGQLNPKDSIIQIIESLKSVGDFMTYPDPSELNHKWGIAAGLLRQLYHTKDSSLIHYLDSNLNFINTHNNPNIIKVTHGTNGSSSFISAYYWYLRYHNYFDLDSISLFKAYARDGLISDLTNQMDMDQLRQYLPYLDSLEIYNLIDILRSQTDLSKPIHTISIWNEFKNRIILDSTLHIRLLFSLSRTIPHGPGDSVLQLELIRFHSLIPQPWDISKTIDYIQKTKNQLYYKSITLPTVDSSELERKKIITDNAILVDSLIRLGQEGGAAPEVLEILEKYRSDEHMLFTADATIEVIHFDSLNSEEKKEYLVARDTTLWGPENRIYMYRGSINDNGMRFDTFSNAELIDFLDSLSVEYMYPTPLDSIPGVIETTGHVHLQKVCQILGDRKAYGVFDPDSSQQEVINRWIDSLVLYGGLDSPSLHVYERWSDASDIIIRFGRLGIPRFIQYVNFPPILHWDKMLRPKEIFKQITETDLLEMISIADHYMSIQDTSKADNLGTYVYNYLSNEIFVDPLFRRPRRPVAPTKERQRWHDEHIWPLLLRMNHWYTRRE